MIIFFDTETTGIPDFKSKSDNLDQPFLVQLAALLTEDNGDEVASLSAIIRPHGYDAMPEGAQKSHGISFEDATRKGVGLASVMEMFMEMATKAETRVAHNIGFDEKLVKIGTYRSGIPAMPEAIRTMLETQKKFCTLRHSTDIVNLPPTPKMVAAGFNKPKAPQLGEAYRFFFKEELEGAHDALIDVRACKRIYFELQTYMIKPAA